MIKKSYLICGSAICMAAVATQAQETNLNTQIEHLQKQLQQTREQFERILREQQQTIDSLKNRIESSQAGITDTRSVLSKKPEAAAIRSTTDEPTLAGTDASSGRKPWTPSSPLRLEKGKSYLDIGLVGTAVLGGSTAHDIEGGTQLGGHDPKQNGFTLQGVEASFTGAVDPYFRANANVLFQIEPNGESIMELEEAWMETFALPGKLQLRAGQMMTEFGRHNSQHPHSWGFADTPLALGRLLGPDGLRNLGARLSWLAPTPFYSELFLSVQNSQGETAHSFRSDHENEPYLGRLHSVDRVNSAADLLFVPRYVMSFDLTDSQTLMLGTSGAFGPNASGSRTDTQVYGADFYWKWKPKRQSGGFPFVSFQTEALLRRFDAASFDWDFDGDGAFTPGSDELDRNGDGLADVLPAERLTDYGLYSQLCWGFTQGWVAGIRGDYVSSKVAQYEQLYGRDNDRATRWRVSPNLTWYPSEYSKIRLQYNFDDRSNVGVDHSIWLQFEFSLGAHAAHKF